MFITFEGCEASGKSTQSLLLTERLKNIGKKIWLTKEPGGTPFANQLREILLKQEIEDGLTELLLISAARHDHILEIEKKLKDGYIVISDRFTDSSMVYQGYYKNIPLNIVQKIIDISTNEIKPDITFLLEVDVKQIEKRISNINRKNNFYDEKGMVFHMKIQEFFLQLAKMNKKRIKIIDHSGTILDKSDKIWNWTKNLLQ